MAKIGKVCNTFRSVKPTSLPPFAYISGTADTAFFIQST
jgi:hypothetical protein